MKARIPALLLILAMAGCAKAPTVAPLTDTEQLAIRNGQGAINSAQRAAYNSKEAVAAEAAQRAYVQTKEYKVADAANKALNATPEAKAVRTTTAAAQQAKETTDFTKAQEDLNKTVDQMFASRHINKSDYVICDGPAESQPACKDVAANKMELRSLKPVVKK